MSNHAPGHPLAHRFSLAALLEYCAERGITQAQLAERGWGVNRTARRRGLSYLVADKVAVTVLHVHPAEIWGPEWFEVMERPREEAA